MNRVIKGLVLAAALTAAVVGPATGGPRGDRTEMVTYERPSGIHVMDIAWIEIAGGVDALPESRPLAGEKKVSIAIMDESGRPVAGVVHQGDADLGDICGQTDSPLQLVSRKPVHVHIYSGPGCADVSAPTSGTVRFTFTR